MNLCRIGKGVSHDLACPKGLQPTSYAKARRQAYTITSHTMDLASYANIAVSGLIVRYYISAE